MRKVEKVFVVFKTHFDIGFTDLAKEVVAGYGRKMLPDVVKTCEETQMLGKNHQFVWTMSAWPLLQSLKTEYGKEDILNKADTLIRNGQIIWHGLPFTTHTEFCGLEEFIRGMHFSMQLAEKFKKWPVSAKMTDVPGHTWILPSLLAKAGVKFLHLGCNDGCTSPDVPRLFFWEGPDGERVLVFYNKGGYGSSINPPPDWNLPVWLALMHTGDNHGPQDSNAMHKILKQAEEELPGTEVIIGTLDDFYNAVSQHLADIPVIKKDLADTWIHGVGTYPREVGQLRESRHVLTDVEKALNLGKLKGVFSKDLTCLYKNKIDGAYEQGILFGEHTWGLDVKTTIGTYGRVYKKEGFLANKETQQYRHLEESWKEQRDRALAVKAFGEDAVPAVLDAIARVINVEGGRIVVFSGLGWKRNGYVKLDRYLSLLEGKELLDASTGETIRIKKYQGEICAYVENIPAFGYKTLVIMEKHTDYCSRKPVKHGCKTGLIENRWFSIAADEKTGTIRSLIEKSTGKEWVDESQSFSFAQYRYDIYGIEDITEFIRSYSYRFFDWSIHDLGKPDYPEQKHLTFIPGNFHIDIKSTSDSDSQSLTLSTFIQDESVTEYGNAKQLKTVITIYDEAHYIDISCELIGKEESLFLEAGHFVFPLNLKNAEIRINKLGSVVNPEEDIPKNANHGLYCCENWVDITDGKEGMMIIPYDMPIFSVGQPAICTFKNEYKKEATVLFFNCFNNSWGTNFPQWIGGNMKFRYRLMTHRGDWKQAEVWKHSFESVQPLLSGYASEKCSSTDSLPSELTFIECPTGMTVQAFKSAEKGDGFVLRLRELKGETGIVELHLPKCIKKVAKCDLLERMEEDFIPNRGSITFETKPFEIHSFYLLESFRA